MHDTEFIIGLMKTETDALGFIPSPTIHSRWIAKKRYIIQHDRRGRPQGYILHGPAKRGQPLYVNQVCIEYDHRLRGYAHLAVRELINRGHQAGSTQINLRCATDLNANWFWMAIGFTLDTIIPGGSRRQRQICVYHIDLRKNPDRDHAPQKQQYQALLYFR